MQDTSKYEKLHEDIRQVKRTLLAELNIAHGNFVDKLSDPECEFVLRSPEQYIDSLSQQLLLHSEPMLTDETKNMTEVLYLARQRVKETKQYLEIISKQVDENENQKLSYENMIAILEDAFVTKNDSETRKGVSSVQAIKARGKFKEMKSTLHELVGILYPEYAPELSVILGELCEQKFNTESCEYVQYGEHLNYILVEFLKMEGIVKSHPRDKQKFKLAI